MFNKREVLRAADRSAGTLRAAYRRGAVGTRWDTTESVCTASYPAYDETHLARNAFEYPVSVNGKLRFQKEYATSMTPAEIQADVVTAPRRRNGSKAKPRKRSSSSRARSSTS